MATTPPIQTPTARAKPADVKSDVKLKVNRKPTKKNKPEPEVETMTVIATATGYFDAYRNPGDEFEVPVDTKKATWFEPVEGGWDGEEEEEESLV